MKYNNSESGIKIITGTEGVAMVSNPKYSDLVKIFIKNEANGELTKAQLETITIIAYLGPITRPEIEEIRGVNCAVIIRNLMIRGLILEEETLEKIVPVYSLSHDALAGLGINSVSELENYKELSQHEYIDSKLKDE